MDYPPLWTHENNTLTRTFTFSNFMESIAFVNRIVPLAEEMDHHPDLDIRYNTVKVTLCTHSAGSIVTEKEVELAEKISMLVS